jgi:hypothetical protein
VFLLPFLIHLVSPGALGALASSLSPNGGLVQQLNTRAGATGSGRFADIGPGLTMWSKSPLYGIGLGALNATGAHPLLAAAEGTLQGPTSSSSSSQGNVATSTQGQILGQPSVQAPIIFDDQYMNTLVTLGLLGLIGIVWFVWGSLLDLARAAKRVQSDAGDLLAAAAIAVTGFAASMLTYDAFSFVQATIIFFLITALGLRLRALLT